MVPFFDVTNRSFGNAVTSHVIQKAAASEFSKLVTTLSPRLWLSWDLLSQFVLQKVCWQFRAHGQYPADLRRCCRKPKGDLNHLEFFESDHFVSFHEMTFIRPFKTKKKLYFLLKNLPTRNRVFKFHWILCDFTEASDWSHTFKNFCFKTPLESLGWN